MYKGTIIEESLEDPGILRELRIVGTDVEPVTDEDHTPWLERWTIHTVEIPDEQADAVAQALSEALEPDHPWYADFKNDLTHYIIFRGKMFRVDRRRKDGYDEAWSYGMSLGIPEQQLDFSPNIL